MNADRSLDWNELAFASKKPLNELNATFIAAPRELSAARFTQIVKTYLPQGNIILGLAKEPYVLGLEDQPQFRMLEFETVQPILDKVNASNNRSKIYLLSYFQRDLPFILEKLDLKQAAFINGSWYRAFHLRPEYYTLINGHVNFERISPFASEQEAKTYAKSLPEPPKPPTGLLTDTQMLDLADAVAKHSLAYSEFQTGVALGRPEGKKFRPMLTAFNRVVPYQTYAMHHGATRERHFSPSNDLNYYDVNHAEVEAIIAAGRQCIHLAGTTFFINLLPCPTCSRMLSSTDIAEFVYREDHSAGYAIRMLEMSGKTVRRLLA